MIAAELLAELELLTHDERVQRMVAIGRAGGPDALLAELDAGASYERRLALTSCFDSRDAERAVQAAQDPSGYVHGLAGRLLALLSSEAQFTDLLSLIKDSYEGWIGFTALELLAQHDHRRFDGLVERLVNEDPE